MRTENVSICMATYNGEKYIKKQIDSILNQLQYYDELIIVDDKSTDSTRDIIKSYSDSRIKPIYNDNNIGVNKNFEKAIINSKNNYIILADQDDIWIDERVNVIIEELKKEEAFVITGNMLFIDSNDNQIKSSLNRLKSSDSNKNIKNVLSIFIGKAAYFGSAMAFSRDICKIILPFPDYIESHDIWIAMAGIILNGNIHCEKNILYRRIHNNNFSLVSRKINKVINSRIIFFRQLIDLYKRKNYFWRK